MTEGVSHYWAPAMMIFARAVLLTTTLAICVAGSGTDGAASVVPQFRWAQRKGSVTLAVEVPRAEPDVQFDPSGLVTFSARSARDGNLYALSLDLFRPINATRCSYVVRPTEVRISVEKATSGRHWPRLLKTTRRLWNMKRDWQLFQEERREGVRWNDDADRPWE